MKNLIIVVIVLQLVLIGMVYICYHKNNGSGFSEGQINDWKEKASRIDAINELVERRNDTLLQKYADSINISPGNNATRTEKLLRISNIKQSYAVEYLKNFRLPANNDPLRILMDSQTTKGFYSLSFDGGDLGDFISLYTSSPKQIDGIRMYIGKYSATRHTDESTADIPDIRKNGYTLIVVGTLSGKDVLPSSSLKTAFIQNYGKPCRPTCDANLEVLGTLGDESLKN